MKNNYLWLAFVVGVLVFGGWWYLPGSLPVSSPTDSGSGVNAPTNMSLQLTSEAFQDKEMIPSQYTCDGDNINPPLSISGVPEGTQSLVIVMDDPDIPKEIKESRGIEKFDHWVLYNLPADTTAIPSGATLGTLGLNSAGNSAYTGPCPPPEYEPATHRYIFRVYALSGKLHFLKAPTLAEVELAAEGMVIEKTKLTGLYSRR